MPDLAPLPPQPASSHPSAAPAAAPAREAASPPPKSRLSALTFAAIGVVYGDIGTSPLYTMREAFGETAFCHSPKRACLASSR